MIYYRQRGFLMCSGGVVQMLVCIKAPLTIALAAVVVVVTLEFVGRQWQPLFTTFDDSAYTAFTSIVGFMTVFRTSRSFRHEEDHKTGGSMRGVEAEVI